MEVMRFTSPSVYEAGSGREVPLYMYSCPGEPLFFVVPGWGANHTGKADGFRPVEDTGDSGYADTSVVEDVSAGPDAAALAAVGLEGEEDETEDAYGRIYSGTLLLGRRAVRFDQLVRGFSHSPCLSLSLTLTLSSMFALN